ncbi:MAG: DUF1223 domain-containing protein [Ginsengibacter sp.]
MKKIISILLLIVSVFIFLSYIVSKSGNPPGNNPKQKNVNNNVSVLELFTSQGCSSCPPADRLLGKYAGMENVIALSYHVDYWNRLGWKDPFSSNVFSQRQKDYANVFKLNGVYTPQLIINGEKEMIGSDANKITSALKTEQVKQDAMSLQINEVKTDDDKITINYTIQGNEKNSILNIALIQNKITTSIKAGENNGVELTNYCVVRNFKKIPATPDGTNTATIDLVKGIDKKDLSVVSFLQNSVTYKIFAAKKSSL